MLEAEMRERKKRNFNSTFTIKASLLLQEAGTEQVRRVLRAWSIVYRCAAEDLRVRGCSSRLFQKNWSPTFSKMQRISAKHSDKKEGFGKKASSEVYSSHDKILPSLSLNRVRVYVHGYWTASCEDAVEYGLFLIEAAVQIVTRV